MAKKKFLTEGPAYNPIASQLAAAISGPAVAVQAAAEPPERSAPLPGIPPETRKEEGGRADVVVPRKIEPPSRPKPAAGYVELNKKVKVGREAFLDLEDLLRDVHAETGTQIPYSILTRAAWSLVIRVRPGLIEQLKHHPLGPLPCTRDHLSFADFEDRLTDALAQAVKKLPRTG